MPFQAPLNASVEKMGVPFYVEMLDNKSGSSNSEDRIGVFKRIIAVLKEDRIAYLVMDREFIGNKWLWWLKHHSVLFANGERACGQR